MDFDLALCERAQLKVAEEVRDALKQDGEDGDGFSGFFTAVLVLLGDL